MAHIVRGERLSGDAPFFLWWTEKGEIINSENFAKVFLVPNESNFDNVAAERTGKVVLAHSLVSRPRNKE